MKYTISDLNPEWQPLLVAEHRTVWLRPVFSVVMVARPLTCGLSLHKKTPTVTVGIYQLKRFYSKTGKPYIRFSLQRRLVTHERTGKWSSQPFKQAPFRDLRATAQNFLVLEVLTIEPVCNLIPVISVVGVDLKFSCATRVFAT